MKNFLSMIVGTHGSLRSEAMAARQGAAIIIHVGDVGKPEIVTIQTSAG